jgi:ABC-2 type transport system ATP-binding protein
MIELENVVQHYGISPVLKGISLRIDRGELAAVVGPNGMGKSTLLSCAAGVLHPQKGRILIDGLERRSSEENEIKIRRTAVYLPDQPWLPRLRSVREYVLAVGRLYDIGDDRLFEHTDRLLDVFELTSQADNPLSGLSAGQKKKAGLAAALVADSAVLLLDEPFSGGLDPEGLMALKRILRNRVDRGGTVLLTSPVAEIVEEIADRVIVLVEGEVLAFDTIDGLRERSGTSGSLNEVLERLLYSDTTRKLENYLRGETL